ncbi:benzoate/H(+) symporter BenE family transporter [Anaeromyxobacter paludicola]|uniref:Benzoate transporter n=1 Tax=Anaeromyxobacter paludicola TaxID=2918171 RepID=A0ABN6N9A1_9BACT|nr:benzoate/H(+) symporter BenE family transporter [Anaeromyxobacter paludicola]BDG09807.1 benzoate transporter [Anaeromyxobacter paludicola]
MSLRQDLSFSAVVAGFVTVLVGYGSSAAIVFQAARACGAGPAEVASWMWALGVGIAVTGVGLSLRYRIPVVTAWSTPGAALIATGAAGLPMSAAVGAFLVSAALILLFGVTRWFERGMSYIPVSLASGMLAGVLLRFGLDVFTSMRTQLLLPLAMFAAYLAGRRLWPRYAVVGVLAVGTALAAARGQLDFASFHFALARPIFTRPTFGLGAVIGLGVPLFAVTMASQNVPGVAVMRASGYGEAPVSPIVSWTGLATLLLAPFGGYALNLAAITAAICMGREAHEDPRRRYVAAAAAGVFYLLLGIFGAAVGALFAAFPKELVAALAGLALFGTIGNGLAAAMRDELQREAALITFLVTASGVTLLGVGSAFWGLVAGVVSLVVLRRT